MNYSSLQLFHLSLALVIISCNAFSTTFLMKSMLHPGWMKLPVTKKRNYDILQSSMRGQSSVSTFIVDGNEKNKTSNLAEINNSSNPDLRTLYPSIPFNSNGTLQLDSGHTLYYEEYGNHTENKKTALSLHGGPGAGCFPNHARFFDPELYGRIILYDQRGCGRSKTINVTHSDTNKVSLITQNNTLSHLVDDIETLRVALGIDKWDLVLGGSWGSTLALAYAQRYPERLTAIVLRGVCLFRDEEIDWLFSNKKNNNVNAQGSIANLNPSGWNMFQQFITTYYNRLDSNVPKEDGQFEIESTSMESPETNHRQTLHSYYDCLLGDDPILRFLAAKSWFQWEIAAGSFHKQQQQQQQQQQDNNSNNTHHQMNDCNMLEWIPTRGIWKLKNYDNDDAYSVDNSIDILKKLRKWSVDDDIFYQQKQGLDNRFDEWWQYDNIIKPVSTDISEVDVSKDGANLTKDQIEFATTFIPAQAILTCFYSVNNQKMIEDIKFDLLSLVEKINHIPCIVVQGGNDFICPPDTALDLHKAWSDMKLRIPLKAGHSMYDPFITHELIKATDHFGKQNKTSN